MEKYIISGMSCAACQIHVEKAVAAVPGVTSVSVNLLTNSMQVEGRADSNRIIKAVEKAGYGAKLAGGDYLKQEDKNYDNILENTEIYELRKRLILSLALLIPLMYISMGHMMWSWPLPDFLSENHIAMGIVQMLLTIFILVINRKFFVNGVTGLIHRAANMDTLVALGAGASFVYSTYVLFVMTNEQMVGNHDKVMEYMHDFYFESAAMIVTLITVGKMLEAYSKGKTTDALKSLIRLAPKTAVIVDRDENGEETEKEISINNIKKGDIFIVRPGDSIPVDGVVIEGNGAVDESAITGESIPIDKIEGDLVSSATINQSGFLKCRAERVGEDTTLSQIIKMVGDAAATKAPIAKVADKVSGVFVPIVMLISVVTVIVWLIVGQSIGLALARGISVLVISCPCALGLATPVAIMVGNGVAAKNGILFKNAVSLENAGRIQIAALDKTGTITEGKPEVTDIIPNKNVTEMELITVAYALELKSEHPLAKAVVKYAENRKIKKAELNDFKAEAGNGLKGRFEGSFVFGGNHKYISSISEITKELSEKAEELSGMGKTPLFFANEEKLLGIIAVADIIKEESREAVSQLKNMGIRVIMLTGDNENTAKYIADYAGVDEVVAGVVPQEKEAVVRKLTEEGKTAMTGDGINDALALTSADIGIAIGAGTDVAIDAADIVLMKSKLSDVPAAIRLSRAVLKNIHENLFWAFIYNIIGIPIAAGVFYPAFGLKLNPMFGAAAMSLSSFCVVTNALRLNLVRPYSSLKDKKISQRLQIKAVKQEYINGSLKKEEKEEAKETIGKTVMQKETEIMEKVMTINGMMCGHCEARVKKVLESLTQVDEAVVSHEKNQAIVKLNSDIADEVLKSIVEKEDYTVEYIETNMQ